MKRFLVFLAVLGGGLAWPAEFNRIVCFGDSLTDVGNTNSATFGFAPGAGYWQGRFSNGPVWVEYFAGEVNVTSPTRSTANGWNYAYGGAKSGSGTVSLVIPNCSNQVDRFLNRTSPTANDLIVVWIGGNDYLDGGTNTALVVSRISADITKLYNRGARQFLIPNMPPLGSTPRYRGTADEAPKNALMVQHNQGLAAEMATLRLVRPGIKITEANVHAAMTAILQNPSLFGFANTTAQAKNLSGINASQYFFWDDVHPTTAAHLRLAFQISRIYNRWNGPRPSEPTWLESKTTTGTP